MSNDTYEPPAHGWTCFHCGETFKTVGGAGDHFGARPDATPGCLMRVQLGGERGLLMALRKVEEELATLYRERADDDTPLHRQIAALQSRHADALENAEETGYGRGLQVRRDEIPGDTHAFKNFHRSLCARFGYVHDDIDWRRDQVSLEEHIAAKIAAQSAEPQAPTWFEIRIEDAPGEGVIIVSTPPVGELMGKFRKAFDGRSATPAEALFMTAWIAIAEEAQRIGAKHNGAG